MNSIRNRLTLWLLGGLAIVLTAAGAGVYLSVRQGLLKSIDAELAVDARKIRFVSPGEEEEGGGPPRKPGARNQQERIPDYSSVDGDRFYQTWTAEGESLEKSGSLGEQVLDFPTDKNISGDPLFLSGTLADGRAVRKMVFKSMFGGKGRGGKPVKGKGAPAFGVITVLAKETTEMETALSSLLRGLFAVGLVVAIGVGLIVRLALNRGLKPLQTLAGQTTRIDAESLSVRFDGTGSPSELQPVYHQLNDLLNRLEASFERERRFSSDLAHEMRTPVAEFKMLNEVALKWPDQAGAETHTGNLEIAIQLEAMIESLLSLARWESGEVSLEKVPVNPGELAGECWKPYREKVAAKQVSVSFDFEPDAVMETDPGMLRHVMNNLFSNAAEYTPEGGEIHVQQVEGGFEISNTTAGLTEDDVHKLCDRYWRKDTARTDSDHSGLGLSLTKACVIALGLTLSAKFADDRLYLKVAGSR